MHMYVVLLICLYFVLLECLPLIEVYNISFFFFFVDQTKNVESVKLLKEKCDMYYILIIQTNFSLMSQKKMHGTEL